MGDAVTDFGPGDEVMTHPLPLRAQGTWAERLIAPANLLADKPATVSWAAAAAFPVPALTAEQVLTEAGIVIPDEQEDEVEKFREFLDQVRPEDFAG